MVNYKRYIERKMEIDCEFKKKRLLQCMRDAKNDEFICEHVINDYKKCIQALDTSLQTNYLWHK